MTFKERDDPTGTKIHIYDDPTGGAGIENQSTLNNREVQQHPERGDKRT